MDGEGLITRWLCCVVFLEYKFTELRAGWVYYLCKRSRLGLCRMRWRGLHLMPVLATEAQEYFVLRE